MNDPTDRFAVFTGWELQALARGISDQPTQRPEQAAAVEKLLNELHEEFDIREEQNFTDPEVTRTP
jgi:hypothetical protein